MTLFKAMDELLLDPKIRVFVFLPIVLLTILVELFRHYCMYLFSNKERCTLEETQNVEMKKRVTVLLRSYKYIPKPAFELRRKRFSPDTGFTNKSLIEQSFPVANKTILEMIKVNSINHLPMIIAGTWVSYTSSGFICTKVPFPLTFSFKTMLQRNIDLAYLNPSWVSSCSWYFLNVFGLRNVLNMFYEDHFEADTIDMNITSGVKTCFKEDFNNLEMISHEDS